MLNSSHLGLQPTAIYGRYKYSNQLYHWVLPGEKPLVFSVACVLIGQQCEHLRAGLAKKSPERVHYGKSRSVLFLRRYGRHSMCHWAQFRAAAESWLTTVNSWLCSSVLEYPVLCQKMIAYSTSGLDYKISSVWDLINTVWEAESRGHGPNWPSLKCQMMLCQFEKLLSIMFLLSFFKRNAWPKKKKEKKRKSENQTR